MKKLLALILAVLMAATMSVTAFADEVSDVSLDVSNTSGSTNVTYNVAPTYSVTIPSSVVLGEDATTATISADNVRVAKGYAVVVKFADNTAFTVTCEGETLYYTVMKGTVTLAGGAEVLTVNPAEKTSGSTELSFSAPTDIKYAGTYTGTVTFTVSVESVSTGTTDPTN